MTRLGADIRSLELDGRDGLFTDVPEDTVDALDGGDDPVADRAEDGEGDLRKRGGDGIDGVDRTDDHGPAHIALALAVHIADTGGLEVGDDAEVLPRNFGKLADFFTDDGIGLAERLKTPKPGPGKGWR